jgi:hypothetical protein
MGTTLTTEESSFTNVPVFTGTGNWSDAARWNVNPDIPGEVSGYNGDATDSPIINGICTLTSIITCNDLTINSNKVLNINPGKILTVNGTLTNNANTSGLIVKSTAAGSGTLMHNNAGVRGTIERYVTGTSNGGGELYHLLSVPIKTSVTPLLSEVFLWSYLARYDEGFNKWHQMNTPTDNSIYTGLGYLTFDPTDAQETYYFPGELNYDAINPNVNYTAGFGWNLIGNPYPSPINWQAIASGTSNIDKTIY